MRFLFWLANHTQLGQRSLEDVIGIFGRQLEALGHEVAWDQKNDKVLMKDSGYNVIVEGFTPSVTDCVAQMHAVGARFVCLATEEPTPKGFNWGTTREMAWRQDEFVKAAPYLDAIFHLVPGQHVTDWFSQHAPTAYVELGYAPALVRFGAAAVGVRGGAYTYQSQQYEPPYDFGFYGTASKRRLRLLQKLANRSGKKNAIRTVMDFVDQKTRDDAMKEAKVLLQIRKFEEMGLVSSSRCTTALCIGRPVVAEPHDLSKPWDEVVQFAKTDAEFLDLALLARSRWRAMHQLQFERFKQKLSPEFCVGRALRQVNLDQLLAAA